jgi:hypothetical protein
MAGDALLSVCFFFFFFFLVDNGFYFKSATQSDLLNLDQKKLHLCYKKDIEICAVFDQWTKGNLIIIIYYYFVYYFLLFFSRSAALRKIFWSEF